MKPANNAKPYQSWGRYPKVKDSLVESIYWRNEVPALAEYSQSVLPIGYGRSYGDSGLNDGGVALDTTPLGRFICFDEEQGVLGCEAGVSLAEILELIVPRGWFLPVTPGTKFVSVAGGGANEIIGHKQPQPATPFCPVHRSVLVFSSRRPPVCCP